MALRLFIAIPVPPAIKSALTKVRDELISEVPRARVSWTRPESMHLTLRFLGDVNSDAVGLLNEALEKVTRSFGSLDLLCERLGCFPAARSPRVLWGGVHHAGERLSALSREISAATAAFAQEAQEERFTGHITLGRVKQKLAPIEARRMGEFLKSASKRVFGTWRATTVELVQSELSASGSRYTVVRVFELAAR